MGFSVEQGVEVRLLDITDVLLVFMGSWGVQAVKCSRCVREFASHDGQVRLRLLLLLGFALGLPQRAVADVDVHAAVHLDDNVRPLAEEARQEPLHQTVTPVRGACEGNVLRTARTANLAKRSLDKLLGVGYESGGLADLGHGGGDEVRLDALHVDTVWLELGAESSGPLLQEGLAAGVGRQKGCGEEATERGHGEDKSPLALLHTRSDELGDAQGGHAVDDNDVVHLLLGCLVEGNRNVVAQTDVVDQDGDVESIHELGQLGVVGVLVLGKVHCQRLDGGLGSILGGDVGGERVELGLGARHEDQVVALGCERQSKLLANAIRGTGDEGPCAARTEFGELSRHVSLRGLQLWQ
jgi:hypothetical protein